jgi:hypothetical protein
VPLARIPKRLRFYEDAAKVVVATVSVAAMRRMVNSIIATVKICIGTRPGKITTAQAKREAGEAIGLMRRGINPNEQKRAAQGRPIACPLSNQIGKGLGQIKRCGETRGCVSYNEAIASSIPLRTAYNKQNWVPVSCRASGHFLCPLSALTGVRRCYPNPKSST